MKTNVALLLLCSMMSACVYNEELLDVAMPCIVEKTSYIRWVMPVTVNVGEVYDHVNIPDEAFAHVQLCIRNDMPNLYLTVESISLCNVCLEGTYYLATEDELAYWVADTARSSLVIETGCLEISSHEEVLLPNEGGIAFIPQRARAWDASELPEQGEQCYLLLNCKVYETDSLQGEERILWSDAYGGCAEVAIPVAIHFHSNRKSTIVLTMAPNCPWYDVSGTSPQALFVPITFDASVEDWNVEY